MSFVLNTLIAPNDIVGIVYAKLVGNTEFLVVGKSSCIEIYSLQGDQLKLERAIDLYDNVSDITTIKLFKSQNVFLVVTTGSSKVFVIGFETLQKEVLLEVFDLNTDGHDGTFSIQSNTLVVNQRDSLVGYFTLEGMAWFHEIDERIWEMELQEFIQLKKKKKKSLFKKPLVMSFPKNGREARTPMIVEKLSTYDDGDEPFILVLYRDDLFNYYLKTFIKKENSLLFLSNLQLEEEIKPILLSSTIGCFVFGKSGIYLKTAPYYNAVSLSTVLDAVEDTSLVIDHNHSKQCCLKKMLPKGHSWNITAAVFFEGSDSGSIKLVFMSNTNELFVSELQTDLDPIKGELVINCWKVDKYAGELGSSKIITQMSSDVFALHGPTSFRVIRLDIKRKSFKDLDRKKYISPILDFNISGTALPKIQVCGGSGLGSGYINTEFKGYNAQLSKIGRKLPIETGVLNLWIFDDHFVFNLFDAVRIFKLDQTGFTEVDDFHGLKEVDGNLLDLSLFHNELLIVTERGVFINGKTRLNSDISLGHVDKTGNITFVSGNTLIHKNDKHLISDDASTIYAVKLNKETHIMVGNWDGSVLLFVNGKKKILRKSLFAVNSVLIKKIGNSVCYITGDASGTIGISVGTSTVDLNIGDAPVTLVDYTEFSFLAYNAENVVKIELDEIGNIVNRGYLNIGAPYFIKYHSIDQKLICFENGYLKEIVVSNNELSILTNETSFPKLVRRAVKFKNFLHLSLFALTGSSYDKVKGREVWNSELHVIDNNNFETKFVYKFDPGIEITDVVNTQYHKELIDTYEEENIGLGMENVLSQCFVVSCAYGSQDEHGPPLMLFSIDELGHLQYQCSCPNINVTFQSLTNHANRMIIASGDSVIAYKIEYSIADSKFSLKRVSDSYRTRYFTSHIESVGPDIIVGDLLKGISRLEMKVKKDIVGDDDSIFKFEESSKEMENIHFLTALETFENIVVTADSLKNIKVHYLSEDSSIVVSQFNIEDQINVIRKIGNNSLNRETFSQLFNGNIEVNGLEDIVNLFVLGSVNGGFYILSLITASDVNTILEKSQETIVRELKPILSTEQDEESKWASFIAFTSVKGSKKCYDKAPFGFINGDLIKRYDKGLGGEIISSKCVLL